MNESDNQLSILVFVMHANLIFFDKVFWFYIILVGGAAPLSMLAMIQYDCLIVIDDMYNVKQITRDLFARFKYCLRQHCFCKNWIIWKVFHKKQMTVGILTGSVGGKWGKVFGRVPGVWL